MNELHAHSPEALGAMATLLRRASGGQAIDVEALQEELLSLVYAIGLAYDGSEDEEVWLELAAEEPSHAALAEGFSQAIDADNPLASAVLRLDLRPELSGRIRKRWLTRRTSERRNAEPTLRHIEWEFLNEAEREEIREMLRDLAEYHRSFVRRGRVQKTELDTALLGLAEIFLQYSGLPLAEHQIPYSINSRFIRFAVLALEPAGQYFEVSPQALSRRWERCVKHMRTGLPTEADEAE